MKKWTTLLLAACLATPPLVSMAQAEALEKVSARVVKVDAERSKVTLKHARINSINMAAMTMPFKVKDASMLSSVRPGDKVWFTVVVEDNELLVTHLHRIPIKGVAK